MYKGKPRASLNNPETHVLMFKLRSKMFLSQIKAKSDSKKKKQKWNVQHVSDSETTVVGSKQRKLLYNLFFFFLILGVV